MKKRERVVVLGASNKPDRYSYKAVINLMEAGYEVIPVNPGIDEINGIKVFKSLDQVNGAVDTVTLYVGSDNLTPLVESIIKLKPRRIISNPGTELELMGKAAQKNGIIYQEACTLIMLATGQF